MVSCSCFCIWNRKKQNKTLYIFFADAVVVVQMEAMDVNEESGYASICVESGVTDGFETALTVSLMANDGKASELHQSYYIPLYLYNYPPIRYVLPQVC